jgi:hypothetical protein
MLRGYVLAAVLSALIGGAQPPGSQVGDAPASPASSRVIGIVEVSGLFAEVSLAGGGFERKPNGARIALRRRPVANSPVAATVSALTDLAIAEYAYEEPGALVYGRQGEWSLVRTASGAAGWLAPDASGPFHSLESLLRNMSYLTDSWDRRLATSPGGALSVRLPADPRRRILGYIEAIQVDDRWIEAFKEPTRLAAAVTKIRADDIADSLARTGLTSAHALVFDRRPGWFQVELLNGRAFGKPPLWIEDGPFWRFVPITNAAELSNLADATWGSEPLDITVLQTRLVKGQLWLEIELLTESQCKAASEGTVRARGWIPAHARSGATTVWFASRGC